MSEYEIRRLEPDEYRAAADVMRAALMSAPTTDDDWNKPQPSWDEADAFAAWDGDRCVGHAAAFRFDTTVPGGARLATAGVTRVGVLPTATRRGALTSMMHQLLAEGRQRGQVLASLRASEAVIYERYGFGVAGEYLTVSVDAPRAGAVRSPAPGTMRLLERDEIAKVVPDLYERVGRRRVGTVSRPAWMFERFFDGALKGTKASHVAVHTDVHGVDDGYVHYDLAWTHETDMTAYAKGTLSDLIGADDAVERALWAYLLDIDLVERWESVERPVDEAGRFALTNVRAYRVCNRFDEQWVRLLDVDAALSARTYGHGRPVVIEVRDPLFDDNNGRWRVSSDGVTRVDAAAGDADLVVPIHVISSAYLGGTSWTELASGGRVDAARPDVIGDADALFAQRPAPFCGTFF